MQLQRMTLVSGHQLYTTSPNALGGTLSPNRVGDTYSTHRQPYTIAWSLVSTLFTERGHFQRNVTRFLSLSLSGMSTMSSISATGRRWWKATRTSHSTTTSGTMSWCPGMQTMYIHSRLTRVPLLSTPMAPATWTSKVNEWLKRVRKKSFGMTFNVKQLESGAS